MTGGRDDRDAGDDDPGNVDQDGSELDKLAEPATGNSDTDGLDELMEPSTGLRTAQEQEADTSTDDDDDDAGRAGDWDA